MIDVYRATPHSWVSPPEHLCYTQWVATIEENYEFWNHSYDWSRYQGDEWSARWGGPDVQWYWSILPRIRHHLPAAAILEIGCGQGRWTQFLRLHCEELVAMDISERCVHACKEKLGTEGIVYRVGDGQSLDFVEDESLDFVFSFESLIHTEIDVLGRYLAELAKKLKPQGVGFLHHSNLGEYRGYYKMTDRVPKRWRKSLKKRGMLDYDEWRARTVTAAKFAAAVEKAGLHNHCQELVPWGGRRLIDCFSSFGRAPAENGNQVFENHGFIRRAYHIQRLSRLYGEGVPW